MSTFAELKKNEREIRRDIIVSATARLFNRKPFHEISMRDIASEAGVSPASIYRYFPNQDDLFVETLIQEISSIEEQFAKRVKNGNLAIEDIAKSHIDYLMDNEATFQLMCHFMIHREINPETLEKFNKVQRYFFGMLDTVMTASGANGNVRILSHAYFASLTGVVMAFRNYPGRDKDEIQKHMHRLGLMIAEMFKAACMN